jgi:hypothetical protein
MLLALHEMLQDGAVGHRRRSSPFASCEHHLNTAKMGAEVQNENWAILIARTRPAQTPFSLLSIDRRFPKLEVNDADPMLTDWWSGAIPLISFSRNTGMCYWRARLRARWLGLPQVVKIVQINAGSIGPSSGLIRGSFDAGGHVTLA